MGRRGPKKTPTALVLARGNPGKRAINRDEPVFMPADLKPPAGLKGRALSEWHALGPELVQAGLLTTPDLKCFEMYCRTVEDEGRYQRLTAKVGAEVAIRLGYAAHLLKIRAQLKQFMAELGITPSSRAGVKVKKPHQSDERKRRFFGITSSSPPQNA